MGRNSSSDVAVLYTNKDTFRKDYERYLKGVRDLTFSPFVISSIFIVSLVINGINILEEIPFTFIFMAVNSIAFTTYAIKLSKRIPFQLSSSKTVKNLSSKNLSFSKVVNTSYGKFIQFYSWFYIILVAIGLACHL